MFELRRGASKRTYSCTLPCPTGAMATPPHHHLPVQLFAQGKFSGAGRGSCTSCAAVRSTITHTLGLALPRHLTPPPHPCTHTSPPLPPIRAHTALALAKPPAQTARRAFSAQQRAASPPQCAMPAQQTPTTPLLAATLARHASPAQRAHTAPPRAALQPPPALPALLARLGPTVD